MLYNAHAPTTFGKSPETHSDCFHYSVPFIVYIEVRIRDRDVIYLRYIMRIAHARTTFGKNT